MIPTPGSTGGDETPDGGTLVYAGIDEAGYGPLLGPLCVGMAVFGVRGRHGDDGADAPDLWRSLDGVVCREPDRSGRGRVAVNDSKRLKLANSVKTRHPLVHLERGVLAFDALRAGGEPASCDDALFERLGCEAGGPAWYDAAHEPLPHSESAEHMRLTAVRLAGAASRAGVDLLDLRVAALHEGAFNDAYRASGSKAAVSMGAVGALLRRVWASSAARDDAPGPTPRVVVDRQGGRTRYADALARALPDATVTVVGEGRRRSAYEAAGAGRRVRVLFEVDAEAAHFPVALASMAAKLVRELRMARFNRYWGARASELKPTAGYRADAERWLADLRGCGAASDDEIRAMRRLA